VGVIALIDGEHHPEAVRDALRRLDLAGVIFCGGEEKLRAGSWPELSLDGDPEAELRRLAVEAEAVVDLSDEPVQPTSAKLELAALALHLGLRYEAPGLQLEPPSYAQVAFDGPRLAVIGTGKRTGKTAVAGHWAGLLRHAGVEPVIVCMGRGGPAEPTTAAASTTLDDLLALADRGAHAASDYLEGAVLAGVRTIGCRRVGGGPAGAPFESNVAAGAELAATLPDVGALVFEGSGSCIPPVEVDRTVCVIGPGPVEPLRRYALLRSRLLLAHPDADAPRGALRFELRPEPAEPIPDDARVALFTTGAPAVDGVVPVLASTNLARRGALARDLDRAEQEGCDLYLTELKAAAIDTVARHAAERRARVVFVRNRPVGVDDALLELADA
jgi:cyclic 2,3-diphosphoglycerate synthetase